MPKAPPPTAAVVEAPAVAPAAQAAEPELQQPHTAGVYIRQPDGALDALEGPTVNPTRGADHEE